MSGAKWIAADWGTSHLRVWLMDGASVRDTAQSGDGMGTLTREGFEPALLALTGPWLDAADGQVTVLACGMVGARQGWVEAAYAAVPCPPLSDRLTPAPVGDPRLRVLVLPGLKQDQPADVMRGEETQIGGFLSLNPGFDGVLCLPGTHCKWAQVSAGEVVSFRSFMTGELFAAIGTHTVLRHSVGAKGWDDTAFAEAVADAQSRPEALAGRLFGLRAEALLHGLDPGAARARLSGLLIGAELAAARPYWLGQQVAMIGDSGIAGPYLTALAAQGLAPINCDAAAMTRAGLNAARQTLKDQSR